MPRESLSKAGCTCAFPLSKEPSMWKTVNVKLMSSAGAIAALVAILEAGRKWA